MNRTKLLSIIVCLAGLAATSHAARQDPKRVDAIWDSVTDRMNHQADVWFDVGSYPECVQLLRFASETNPGDYEINTNLGWMLENINRYDEALAVYVRFRKANPNMADAAFPEANFYFARKAYAKVPPLLSGTLGAHTHPNSFRLLAHSYEKMGMYTDAEKVWKQLVALHPEDLAAKVNLAKVEKHLAPGSSGQPVPRTNP